MPSRILELSAAIASALSAEQAEVCLYPSYSLRDLETRRTVVVPQGVEYRALSRRESRRVYKVAVGFLRRTTEDGLPTHIAASEAAADAFLHRRLGAFVCTGAEHDPLYSPEQLRENGVFASVLVLEFTLAA